MCGALVTFMLGQRRTKSMSSQLVISRQALDEIRVKNEDLLKQIQEKENIILQMQMEILGYKNAQKRKPRKSKN
ncbi:MAG: hypothetical protein II219_00615 [Alphaproteobacteria bacterium]|nr:hypothetical protein [Alphaproteobacteria bacterium]